jgi:hypothetical protein
LFAAGNLSEFSGDRGADLVAAGVVERLAAALEDHCGARIVQQYACKLACVLVRSGQPPAGVAAASAAAAATAAAAKKKSKKSTLYGSGDGDGLARDPAAAERVAPLWEAAFVRCGVPALLRRAKSLHAGDKAGVVRWADAAEREMQREVQRFGPAVLAGGAAAGAAGEGGKVGGGAVPARRDSFCTTYSAQSSGLDGGGGAANEKEDGRTDARIATGETTGASENGDDEGGVNDRDERDKD